MSKQQKWSHLSLSPEFWCSDAIKAYLSGILNAFECSLFRFSFFFGKSAIQFEETRLSCLSGHVYCMIQDEDIRGTSLVEYSFNFIINGHLRRMIVYLPRNSTHRLRSFKRTRKLNHACGGDRILSSLFVRSLSISLCSKSASEEIEEKLHYHEANYNSSFAITRTMSTVNSTYVLSMFRTLTDVQSCRYRRIGITSRANHEAVDISLLAWLGSTVQDDGKQKKGGIRIQQCPSYCLLLKHVYIYI